MAGVLGATIMKFVLVLLVCVLFFASQEALSSQTLPLPQEKAEEYLEAEGMVPLSLEDMESNRGTSGFNPAVLNTAELSAVNTGNTLTNPVAGTNIISDNAFMNSNGVINVVQNSGNGVVIQNSTIVNLTLQ
jgi:hypothetical protein